MMERQELNARVAGREDLHGTLAIFRVAPLEGLLPLFEPGQYTRVGVRVADGDRERLVARAFSIASPPEERGLREFLVRRVEGGRFTSRLWELGVGDRMWMDPKVLGSFTLERLPPGANLVMVATGTGISPYMSMLRHDRGRHRWLRCVLVHGVRTSLDLAYREELELLQSTEPGFLYLPTVSREPEGTGWRGLRGRVQAVLAPDTWGRLAAPPFDPAHAHVFLCGNPEMIAELSARLEGLGFTPDRKDHPGNLHTERYW